MEVLYLFLLTMLVTLSTHASPVPDDSRYLYYADRAPAILNRLFLVRRQAEPDIGYSDESLDDSPRRHYYRPYVRIRRVYRTHYQPRHPLSNYADSYDRFPTVA
uniref:Uncharacterized protein LOC114343022 n=1 Tax=Diabrotica virgifera virgifera TaxID=50390 RepID=A0A6P7GW64_DIAVI